MCLIASRKILKRDRNIRNLSEAEHPAEAGCFAYITITIYTKTMYDHNSIEEKWQKRWLQDGTNRTDDDLKKKKCYALVMFPYPSGEGLHVGHARVYIAADIYARMKRMLGYRVLHPMGCGCVRASC